jgi:uncharacterized membrane protein
MLLGRSGVKAGNCPCHRTAAGTTVRGVGIAMELVPSSLSVDPGRLGSMQVHLTNSGPEATDVAVQLPPDDRDWSWVHPESCPVEPGGEAVVAVYFKPKCGCRPTAGTHRVAIVAHTAGEEAASATSEGLVQVGPFSDAAAALEPMVARDQRGVSYHFKLENTGNVPLRAALSTTDPSGGLAVDVEPREVRAEPGETATATVTVQARKGLKRGEQRFRVCVLADVEGGSEFRVEGAFYQQGSKPAK